jgi:ribonuclease HI
MGRFYTVWAGKVPGIYESWADCKFQTEGFSGAKYKSFPTRAAAEEAYTGIKAAPAAPSVGDMYLAVDGACNSEGVGEFRGVLMPGRVEVFGFGPHPHSTNNVMEFLAICKGLRWIADRGLRIPLYSDSKVAILWLENGTGTCNTTHPPPTGSAVSDEIATAEKWLRAVRAKLPNLYGEVVGLVAKWDTKARGEIPADYGRK